MSEKFDTIIHTVLVIVIIFLSIGLFMVYKRTLSLPLEKEIITRLVSSCGEGCDEDKIKEVVSEEIAKVPTATPKIETVVKEVYKSERQTSFITLGQETTTTSTDWVNVPGSRVTFDIKNDYSPEAIITWQVSLKVAHSNGTAFARLYDETHEIAILGSDLAVTDSDEYLFKTSGNLNFWSGNNTYKMQIKSLNSFEVSSTGGKIKISY